MLKQLANTKLVKVTMKHGGELARYLSKNSPTILTGCAVTGLVVTVALAIKATPKAIEKIKEEKKNHMDRLKIINGDQEITEEEKEELAEEVPLKATEVVKATWQEYIPMMIAGAGSVACIIGAHTISAKRTAAMAALYSMSETALKEYKDKAAEVVGASKADKISDAVAEDKAKAADWSSVVRTGHGETWMLETLTGQTFLGDVSAVQVAVAELLQQMYTGDYRISVNEYLEAIGLKSGKLGDMTGWNTDNPIKLNFRSSLKDDLTPCLVLDHENMPGAWYFDS